MSTQIEPDFPARFKAARLKAGYTSQEAVAAKIGKTRGYVVQIETGATNVSLEKQYELATVLGIDPNKLDPRLKSVRKAKP